MAMLVRLVITIGLAFAAVDASPAQSDGQKLEEFLEDAIAQGQFRQIEPYLLRHVIINGNQSDFVGVVYTPYVRVARFVWARTKKGQAVRTEDIPADLWAPFIYVGMQQPGRTEPAEIESLRIAEIRRPMGSPPPGQSAFFFPDSRRLGEPLRVLDPITGKELFGNFPVDRIAIIGVFPMALAERQVLEFCTYREGIDAAEARSWRVISGFTPGPLR